MNNHKLFYKHSLALGNDAMPSKFHNAFPSWHCLIRKALATFPFCVDMPLTDGIPFHDSQQDLTYIQGEKTSQ